VLVEQGAGLGSALPDDAYAAVGARIVPTAHEVWLDMASRRAGRRHGLRGRPRLRARTQHHGWGDCLRACRHGLCPRCAGSRLVDPSSWGLADIEWDGMPLPPEQPCSGPR
jgi:hypothetical protein